MTENDTNDDETQSLYELPYDEQPVDEWMKCPWADDPEASKNKKGDYAKKCPCPNCIYHTYTDELPSQRGPIKRFAVWLFGESDFCRTCGVHNDCTSTDADCGWAGRVSAIRVNDDDMVVMEYDQGGPVDAETGDTPD